GNAGGGDQAGSDSVRDGGQRVRHGGPVGESRRPARGHAEIEITPRCRCIQLYHQGLWCQRPVGRGSRPAEGNEGKRGPAKPH
ncbi:unnamed protein product, partial [Ectocarpus sp. 12 AP-2014]